jgi:hypothetical protein
MTMTIQTKDTYTNLAFAGVDPVKFATPRTVWVSWPAANPSTRAKKSTLIDNMVIYRKGTSSDSSLGDQIYSYSISIDIFVNLQNHRQFTSGNMLPPEMKLASSAHSA